jgi:ABC-2 type transport system permease protein
VGGTIEKVAKCLPFLYATKVARAAIDVDFKKENFIIPMAVVLMTALVLTVLASFVFSRKMKKIV